MTTELLEQFCDEMRALAARIDAPTVQVPACARSDWFGYSVVLAPDGQGYALTNAERGVPVIVAESRDKAEFMERVFVEITMNMSAESVVKEAPATQAPPTDGWPFDRMRALKQRREIDALQEELLGRLDAEWRDRQAVRNALNFRKLADELFGE